MRKIALYCGGLSLLAVFIGVFPLWGQESAPQDPQAEKVTVVPPEAGQEAATPAPAPARKEKADAVEQIVVVLLTLLR